MKQIKFILLIVAAGILLFTGCEKAVTTEDESRITHYVLLNLVDEGQLTTIAKGTAFTDPGFTAMEGTTDVANKVVVTGSVNTAQVGFYQLSYKVENVDGFAVTATREVIVYDPAAPAADLTGNYLGNPKRQAPYTRAFNNLNVSVEKVAPGVFYCSDFLGGFYDQGSNYRYGPNYAGWGYFTLNADNTITLLYSHFNAWGDSLDDLDQGTYNPLTKALQWHAYYAGLYTYIVDLTFVP